MNNLQLLTTEELENTKGGVGLAEIVAISGVANFFVSVFNAGYKFGADLAINIKKQLKKISTVFYWLFYNNINQFSWLQQSSGLLKVADRANKLVI